MIFTIKKLTPTYQTLISKLVIYLIPHMTNAIITDENDVIIDVMRKSASLEDKNPLLRGVKFRFEESENKDITLEDDIESIRTKIGNTTYQDILKRVNDGENIKDIINEGLSSKTYYAYKNDILSLPLKYQECQEIDLESLSKIY
jgi:predicted ribosome quality control (RQC) complex YloA/Tae2 family protein